MLLNEQRPGFTVLDSADKKCRLVMSLDFASKDCSVYGKSGLLLASQIYATVLNSLL